MSNPRTWPLLRTVPPEFRPIWPTFEALLRHLAESGVGAAPFGVIPRIPSSGGPATLAGRGCCYSMTGGMTVPANVFDEGHAVSFFNATAGNLTLTQGAGLTLYLAGTATTGNRTLAQRALVTVWFDSPTVGAIIGAGLT